MTARLPLLLLVALVSSARADLREPRSPGLIPQTVTVTDEQGSRRSLADMAKDGRPILLIPAFTRCPATCPLLVEALKSGISGLPPKTNFTIIFFSFDPSDTLDHLRKFRGAHHVPADWQFVLNPEVGSTRAFLDQLDYHFMIEANNSFNHPNQAFIFSPTWKWSATLSGLEFPTKTLQQAYDRGWAMDHPRLFGRFTQRLTLEHWVAIAFVVFLLSSTVGLGVLWRRRRT